MIKSVVAFFHCLKQNAPYSALNEIPRRSVSRRPALTKLFTCLSLLCCLAYPDTPDIYFQHINENNGLAFNFVTSIAEDSSGFLWIGTLNGLDRYDGYSFKHYRYDAWDSTSIGSSRIASLLMDSKERLWIGTNYSGLERYIVEKDSFVHYFDPNGQTALATSNFIYTIYEDPKHLDSDSTILLLGSRGALLRFNVESGAVSELARKSAPEIRNENFSIHSVIRDHSGRLWIATAGGIFYSNDDGLTFLPVSFEEGRYLNPEIVGNSIIEDHVNRIWIGTDHGVFYKDPAQMEFKLYLADIKAQHLYEDEDSTLWIACDTSGLYRVDVERGDPQHFVHKVDDLSSLNTNALRYIYKDRSGVMWIGSKDNGLNRFSSKTNKFYHLNKKNRLEGAAPLCGVYTGEGDIWLGTLGKGLFHFNPVTIEIERIQSPALLNDLIVVSIDIEREGDNYHLLLGTQKGLVRFSPHLQSAELILSKETLQPVEPDEYILNIFNYGSEESELWLGTSRIGLIKFSKTTGETREYRAPVIYPDGQPQNILVTNFCSDRRGRLWIASRNGLFYMEPGSDRVRRFVSANERTIDNRNELWSIREDTAGNLLVGTGSGLIVIDAENNITETYSIANGLVSEQVYNIHIDADEKLWLGTGNGIAIIDRQGNEISTLTRRDGLPMTLTSGTFSGRDGTLYYTSREGLTWFHPKDIKKRAYQPPIVISEFLLHNQPVPISASNSADAILRKPIHLTDRITLDHDENYLGFTVSALDFAAPSKNRYRYKLIGRDDEWQDIGERHYIELNKLDHGDYTLVVEGTNNDGIWNPKARKLDIEILPPPYKSKSAYLFYILATALIAWASFRAWRRRSRLRKEIANEKRLMEKEAEMNELKSQFFTNVSHDFRTPLTLISAPVEKLLRKHKDPDTLKDLRRIKDSAERLESLIDALMHIDKLEKGNVPLKTRRLNIVDLVMNTTFYMEDAAGRKQQTISCRSEKPDIAVYIDRAKVERILVNLIGNACKYTPNGGEITVTISNQSPSTKKNGKITTGDLEFINIAVKDNGPGLTPEEAARIFDRFYQGSNNKDQVEIGSGIGLSLAQGLAELHHGKITLETEPGKGSEFTLSLPLGKAHLSVEEILEDPEPDQEFPGKPSTNGPEEAFQLIPNGHTAEISSNGKAANPDRPLVLIVEDFEDLRHFMQDNFSTEFQVDVAADGLEGLTKAQETVPDLIISDVMMPKMSGLQMCRELKQDQKTRHVPLILLTARTTNDEKLQGLSVGADAYIPKPFDLQELRAQAANLIKTRRAMVEYIRKDHLLFPDNGNISSHEQEFMDRVVDIIIGNLSNGNFQNSDLAEAVGYTRQNLSLKIKKLTGVPTNEFISEIRLKRATQLLKKKSMNISEIALEVGYNSPAYFAKRFRERYGMSPREYMKNGEATDPSDAPELNDDPDDSDS